MYIINRLTTPKTVNLKFFVTFTLETDLSQSAFDAHGVNV